MFLHTEINQKSDICNITSVYNERQGICYLCESCLMHDSETWPMKVEHELKMNRTEMSMIRWMYGVKLNKRKKSELRELLVRYSKIVIFQLFLLRFGHGFNILFVRNYSTMLFYHQEKNYIVVLVLKNYRQVIWSSFDVELWQNSSVNEFRSTSMFVQVDYHLSSAAAVFGRSNARLYHRKKKLHWKYLML